MSDSVQLSDFEGDKENIQPLKEGRDPQLLLANLNEAEKARIEEKTKYYL